MVIELLRSVEGSELEELLRQIRSAESVDGFLDSVHEAALLLPLDARSRLIPNNNGQESNDKTCSKQGENNNANNG